MALKDWGLTKKSRQETVFTNKTTGKKLATEFVTFPERRWQVVVGKGGNYVGFGKTKSTAMKHARAYMKGV